MQKTTIFGLILGPQIDENPWNSICQNKLFFDYILGLFSGRFWEDLGASKTVDFSKNAASKASFEAVLFQTCVLYRF